MIVVNLLYIFLQPIVYCNTDASRLFEDLLVDYNKLVRPVDNKTNALVVRFKLKLSQLLDVVSSDILYLFQFPRSKIKSNL